MEASKMKLAIQMVIMDAIEKGHTDPLELAEYMKTKVFEKQALTYYNGLMGM